MKENKHELGFSLTALEQSALNDMLKLNELLTIGNHHDMDTPPMIDITEEMRSVGAIIYARPEDIDSGMKQPRYSFMQFGDQRQTIKQQLKAVLMANGMYAGSSRAAKILRELADEWDD